MVSLQRTNIVQLVSLVVFGVGKFTHFFLCSGQTLSGREMSSINRSQCAVCHLPFAQDTGNHAGCPFCQRTFARVDGARRHARTCRSRKNRPLPRDAKRGRKLRACDRCSRIKVSCDAKTPCGRCAARSLTCTYRYLCTNPTHQRCSPQPNETRDAPKRKCLNLSALLNWTDPKIVSLSDMVVEQPEKDPGQASQQEPKRVSFEQWNTSLYNSVDDTIDPKLLLLGLIDLSPDQIMEYGSNCSGIPPDTPFPSQALAETSNHGLADRMMQLAADLRQFTAGKPHLHCILDIASLNEFLTSTNCSALIAAYSRRQYYHQWPIVHWPTFNPEQAALPLLLAIMLTGDTYSYRRNETPGYVSPTRAMQIIADKYIFSHIKNMENTATSTRESLELFQAAFLMNSLHINMNDIALRRRVVTNRHPLLISTLRRLGLTETKHELSGPGLKWHTFIYRETCIRLVTWTFLIDSLLTVYCNHPPLMSLAEMSSSLPCNDNVWDAGSLSSFEELMGHENLSSRTPSLKTLVANLLSKDWTSAMTVTYDALTAQNLYIIIMGE